MILHDLIESFLRGIDGRVGKYLRRVYYRSKLKRCGQKLAIEPGVHILNPSLIEIGDNVWIDRNVVLIAGKINEKQANFKRIENQFFKGTEGEIHIGSFSHIGIGTVIQGHGGVFMDDYCTTSAGCKIYSYSNDLKKSRTGTLVDTGYILHPVMMERNVWLGLNCILLGHHVGMNTFVKPNSVITQHLPSNVIFDGPTGETKNREFDA